MTKTLALLLVLLPLAAMADVQPVISEWDQHHPPANAGLSSWVHKHPDVAGKMFGWNRYHPLRGQMFVRWMAEHPEQSLSDFIDAHSDWPIMDLVFRPNQDALEELVAWGHTHTEAARDLAAQPRGFAWVGFHLYRGLWDGSVAPDSPADIPVDEGQQR